MLFTWIDISCSFICSFIFVIFSSHVTILILIGSFSFRWNRSRPIFSKFDQTNLIKQKYVKFCSIHYQNYLIQENLIKTIWPCISRSRHIWLLKRWKNAQLFSWSICSELYHHKEPKTVNVSCKTNELFLYERNISLKWDMILVSWVKTFKQKKGFTFPAPKAQR